MANVEFSKQEYGSVKNILFFKDHYVAIPQYFDNTSPLVVTTADGKKIIPQGAIFPSNDANALGVVANEYDVTKGARNGAVFLHAFIETKKIPVAPSTAAKAAMPMIKFIG